MEESTKSPPPGDLPSIWRQRAQFLKEYGDPNSGRLWALAATELDQSLRVLGEDTLTLGEAAALSGYSADHIGSLVRHGMRSGRLTFLCANALRNIFFHCGDRCSCRPC